MSDRNIRLFAISFVALFLEIFLIRWISTEIRIFAYFSNLVLLACFLGIGIGCYFSNKKANVLFSIGVLAFIALATQSHAMIKITSMLSGFSDSVMWYNAAKSITLVQALQGGVLTIFMFLMILAAFIPLGQILGEALDGHHNIVIGYSVNILGSLVGIWFFNWCAFSYTPPFVWFLVSLIILFFFVPKTIYSRSAAVFLALFIVLITSIPGDSLLTMWSPYQKLDMTKGKHPVVSIAQDGYLLLVNNVGYMTLLNRSEDYIKRRPDLYDMEMGKFNQYELPYRFTDVKNKALIVAAGGGNDAAGALRSGVQQVDGVEIDPGIYELGRAYHPERPYQDPRVHIVIDDARAFLKKNQNAYDVISFGLLDSHNLSSAHTNLRPDHYIYTEESFKDAKKNLGEDGVLAVSFFVDKRAWVGERIYGLLKKVFGGDPYAFNVYDATGAYGGVMYVTSRNLEKLKATVGSNPELKDHINKNAVKFSGNVKLTTDDWPYLYIEKPGIPRMYLLIIFFIAGLLLIVSKVLMSTQRDRINLHFFFLGAAFLLLEFQNISKANLIFGSTWIVNAYIISSILLLALLANLFVYYVKPRNVTVVYLLLFVSVVIVYIMPLDLFNSFGYWSKSLLATTVLNLPIFFSGIIFIKSFKDAPAKNVAFGSNLIGAAVGGLLESLSFITGVKALLIVVFLLYLASYVYLKSVGSRRLS
jgi:spermidine synthase